MNLIKLTQKKKDIYVNVDHISTIEHIEEASKHLINCGFRSIISYSGGGGEEGLFTWVDEAPHEVAALVERATTPLLTIGDDPRYVDIKSYHASLGVETSPRIERFNTIEQDLIANGLESIIERGGGKPSNLISNLLNEFTR